MRAEPKRDLWVGLFVLAGLAGIAWLSFSAGGIQSPGAGGLDLVAVPPRAPLAPGPPKVGQIKSIDLADDFRARVTMEVNGQLQLPADTSASILTAGVLGDQYVALEPGGDAEMLQNGDQIQFTQSAVILERLIGKLVQNLGGGSKE
jgi:phospholipid/cholesterol/gamma-HCH transport system substrate-binding protein